MINSLQTRRQFLNLTKLSAAFLLASCSRNSNKLDLGIQNKFYPDSFLRILPNSWNRKNINFSNLELNNNYKNSELLIVNDGWFNKIDFDQFKNITNNSENKLDDRAENILSDISFEERKKLFPIGIIPYAVVIKNNKDLKIRPDQAWDFLLSENLKNKIILPESPRVLISLSQRMNSENSLQKLLSQAFSFDDKNALNWLINSDINLAIMPFSLCYEAIKIDSRLSFLFPDYGVPLIWNFMLTRSELHCDKIADWINSLDNEFIINRLRREGFYLPFEFKLSKNDYEEEILISKINTFPSKKCWQNSWSLTTLTEIEKKELESFWLFSRTP